LTASSSPPSDYRKGLTITFIGAMFITFDTPVLRLIDGPQWTVMFWRSVLLSLSVLIYWLVMRARNKTAPPLINGKSGMVIILLYSAGNLTFITAVFNTTIANVVFILALTPLFAAVLSFLWFRERLGPATWLALAMSLFGVAIIVWSGLNSGSILGDLMAALTALAMACAFTITRRANIDMSMSPIMVGAISATAALLISGVLTSGSFSIDVFTTGAMSLSTHQWGWMLINGVIIMPISYSLLALGPRYITSAEVALFLLLETALAPIWVWLAVGEKVTFSTLIGGGIILTTLLLHSLNRMLRKRSR